MSKNQVNRIEYLEKYFQNKVESFFLDNKPADVCVALSGGSDSLALTILLKKFCDIYKINLCALTINHNFRQESTEEAKSIQELMQKLSISHHIIEIPKKTVPKVNIEANLRKMRYQLLTEFCSKNKIKFLFLGHQIDDVAENILIRLWRGSGIDGISSIAEIFYQEQVAILRPLLSISKVDLQEYLISNNISWYEDESNQEDIFLRNKIRKFINSFEDRELIKKRLKKAGDEAFGIRNFCDDLLLKEASKFVYFNSRGYFIIEKQWLANLHFHLAIKLLSLIIMELGKKLYKPRFSSIENIYKIILTNDFKPINIGHSIVKRLPKSLLKFNKNNFINPIVIYCDNLTLKDENINLEIKLKTILCKIFN